MLTRVSLVMAIIEAMGAAIIPVKVFKLARHFSETELQRILAAINRKESKNVS